MSAPELSVVVVAFDEEENTAPVLGELSDWLARHEPDAEIVFVDDGSSDATGQRARGALEGCAHQVIQHDVNRGIGAALKSGVHAARGTWVTFLPADGQVSPDAIGALREAATKAGADVAFSVYRHRADGWSRRILSGGLRSLILVVYGVWLRSEGPYLFRRSLFDVKQLRANTFFLNFEFPIRMLRAGTPATHVVIECRARWAGRSKIARARKIGEVGRDLVALRCRLAKEAIIARRSRARPL